MHGTRARDLRLAIDRRTVLVFVFLFGVLPSASPGAELQPETAAAYERYISELEQRFAADTADGDTWLEGTSPATLARARNGEIVAWPGREDGIFGVPGGLVHHWRGVVFVPDATLAGVLAVAQDYGSYAGVYDWIIRSALLRRGEARRPAPERFWTHLRIERSASVVTSTLDIWTAVEYRYPQRDLATAVSNADCIRQVENAGRPDERRLPVGRGSGYLWRANTLTVYLERDGGVYVGLQTIGLSRRFPALFGWIVEPIARRLGRGSAADSLRRLRETVAAAGAQGRTPSPPPIQPVTGWCGDPAGTIPG